MSQRLRSPTAFLPTAICGAALALGSAACDSSAPVEEMESDGATLLPQEAPDPGPTDTYDRTLLFLSPRSDSTLAVPFSFRAVASASGVRRETRAWLDRSGEWDAFFQDSWTTGPTRIPWRLHPRGPIRLIAAQGDQFQRIIYEEGPRSLELLPGEVLSDFTGPRGGTYRLQLGALLLGERRVEGVLLDASRAWRDPSNPAGDLVLLVSGDSLQIVLSGAEATGETASTTPWRGWGRMDLIDRIWEEADTHWTGTRAFEPARREIPDGWRWASPDSSFVGTLQIRSSHLEAGAGEDPILPVEAVFEVEGIVGIDGREFSVNGIVRHSQRARIR